jgi:hypothetical protein
MVPSFAELSAMAKVKCLNVPKLTCVSQGT